MMRASGENKCESKQTLGSLYFRYIFIYLHLLSQNNDLEKIDGDIPFVRLLISFNSLYQGQDKQGAPGEQLLIEGKRQAAQRLRPQTCFEEAFLACYVKASEFIAVALYVVKQHIIKSGAPMFYV